MSAEDGLTTATRAADAPTDTPTNKAEPLKDERNGVANTSAASADAPQEAEDGAKDDKPAEDDEDDEAANGDTEASKGDGTKGDSKIVIPKRPTGGAGRSKGKKSKSAKVTKEYHLDAKPGEYYFANLKGHPPWPSIICDEEMLPEQIIATRPVSAKRADGTYREDYDTGGKNQNERSHPVMYLFTNEFSWMVNHALKPLDPTSLDGSAGGKKSQRLLKAYELAAENHPLQHWKDVLAKHQKEAQDREAEEAARIEQKELAKAEKKKAKASGGKRKSKAADDDEDMPDAPPEDEDTKTPKSSKKRKKAEAGDAEEDGKPAKTPKTSGVKLSLKTPNGTAESASKAKPKGSTAKKAQKDAPAAKQTPEEQHQSRSQSILFLRHKLQKGFLTRDQPPKEDEMGFMDNWLNALESQGDIEADIIRSSRIHKVLKGILKLEDIPLESKHNFKARCQTILDKLTKTLNDNPEGSGESSKKENGTDEDKQDPPAADVKEEDKKDDAPAEPKKDAVSDAKKGDEPMPDADDAKKDASKDIGEDKEPAEEPEKQTAAEIATASDDKTSS